MRGQHRRDESGEAFGTGLAVTIGMLSGVVLFVVLHGPQHRTGRLAVSECRGDPATRSAGHPRSSAGHIQIGLAPALSALARARSLFPACTTIPVDSARVSLYDALAGGAWLGQLLSVTPAQAGVPCSLPRRAGCAFGRCSSALPVNAIRRPGRENHGRYRLDDLTAHVDSAHMTDVNAKAQ